MIGTKIIDVSTGLNTLQTRARHLYHTCAMLVIFQKTVTSQLRTVHMNSAQCRELAVEVLQAINLK